MKRFSGQSAIVTGGASGIGAAITRRLIAEGANVLVADINAAAVEAVPEVFGSEAKGLRTDVTREADMEQLFEHAKQAFGGFDSVFNVAGGSRAGLLVDSDLETWDFNFRINLHSTFLGTKLAAKHFMAEGRAGAIVNIASLNGHSPAHSHVAYSAAKAGVIMLTKGAAMEFGDRGIRINSVSPGLVETPLIHGLMNTPGVREAYFERIPAKRLADPDEIAGVALFLASPEAAYINGTDILVDGAWTSTVFPDLRPLLAEEGTLK